MAGRGRPKKQADDWWLPKAPPDPDAYDPYRYHRGRNAKYPMLIFPGTPPALYGDDDQSRQEQEDHIRLLEGELRGVKAGFRLSPALDEALKQNADARDREYGPGALVNAVRREACKGGSMTVPPDASQRSDPEAWVGTAVEAVGERLGMKPQTVSRSVERTKAKRKAAGKKSREGEGM